MGGTVKLEEVQPGSLLPKSEILSLSVRNDSDIDGHCCIEVAQSQHPHVSSLTLQTQGNQLKYPRGYSEKAIDILWSLHGFVCGLFSSAGSKSFRYLSTGGSRAASMAIEVGKVIEVSPSRSRSLSVGLCNPRGYGRVPSILA